MQLVFQVVQRDFHKEIEIGVRKLIQILIYLANFELRNFGLRTNLRNLWMGVSCGV
jgi:hypothetical protein